MASANQAAREPDQRRTIFILDDDQDVRRLLETKLSHHFQVATFENPSALVDACSRCIPDVILLDVKMPNIDGFEVLSLLRRHLITSSIPVISMSADPSLDFDRRAHELGAIGYLRKPFQMDRLHLDIQTILESTHERIASHDHRVVFEVHFNNVKRAAAAHSLIEASLNEFSKVVYLGWSRGDDFLKEKENEWIESEKLIYLHVKPALMLKFPYLQDLSPVIQDLVELVDLNGYRTHLIFDEIRNIFNVYDHERYLTRAYMMRDLLSYTFDRVTFLSTLPSDRKHTAFIQKIARVFTQRESI